MTSIVNDVRASSDPTSRIWEEGFAVQAEVFIDSGYVASSQELVEEYQKYFPVGTVLSAYTGALVGGSALVVEYEPKIGFKTLDDIASGRLELDRDKTEDLAALPLPHTLEVGTLGVKRELRGLPEESERLAVSLYGAILGLAGTKGASHLIASFDDKFFWRFKDIFGPSVLQLGPAVDYMGSPTIPSLINLEALISYAQHSSSGLYETMKKSAAAVQYE